MNEDMRDYLAVGCIGLICGIGVGAATKLGLETTAKYAIGGAILGICSNVAYHAVSEKISDGIGGVDEHTVNIIDDIVDDIE